MKDDKQFSYKMAFYGFIFAALIILFTFARHYIINCA